MKKPKILVVGSISMDLICTTKRVPEEGETVIGETFAMAPGGKGANQAVQMARLGADVTMIGCVGGDAFGNELVRSLSDAGVNTDYMVRKEDVGTGCAQITLDMGNGKAANRILVMPQANFAMESADLAFLEQAMVGYDLVVLQNEIAMAVNLYAAQLAKGHGIPVVYNPAPAAPIPAEIIPLVTYLCPNEHEAYELTGVKIVQTKAGCDLDTAKSCGEALRKMGFQKVLITLGENGSFYLDDHTAVQIPCAKATLAADTTAAGDSFIGAFCVALCRGSETEDAMTFASKAAAITVSRFGAQPSLPYLHEVEKLI